MGRIPPATVKRLCFYLHLLERLKKEGKEYVSSKELAERLDLTDTQVRRDLVYFGKMGKRGMGYEIEKLIKELRKILKIEKPRRAILIGAGNLGTALLASPFFRKRVEIVAAFDADINKVGRRIHGVPVYSDCEISRVVREMGIKIAILTTPPDVAPDIAGILINAGIQGILNFTPASIKSPPGVFVHDVDLTMELEYLSFFVEEE